MSRCQTLFQMSTRRLHDVRVLSGCSTTQMTYLCFHSTNIKELNVQSTNSVFANSDDVFVGGAYLVAKNDCFSGGSLWEPWNKKVKLRLYLKCLRSKNS